MEETERGQERGKGEGKKKECIKRQRGGKIEI